MRGFGDTTYEPETYLTHEDALAVIDAAGLRAPIVIGSSMGGRAALDLALEHPDRVSALALIGSAISGEPDGEEDPEPLASLWNALHAASEVDDLDEVNRLEAHIWLDGSTAHEGRVTGAGHDLFLDMNGKALESSDPGDSGGNAWSRLGELSMPVLVLIGDLDIQVTSPIMADQIPGARLVELKGTAHLPQLEGHQGCLGAITDFVAEMETAQRGTRQ